MKFRVQCRETFALNFCIEFRYSPGQVPEDSVVKAKIAVADTPHHVAFHHAVVGRWSSLEGLKASQRGASELQFVT